jgi:hypothetical protein
VVVGNQRLCCLRVLSKKLPTEDFKKLALDAFLTQSEIDEIISKFPEPGDTPIPVRICLEKDPWSDST